MAQLVRDTFCSFCGSVYPMPLVYPRTCQTCKMQVWANPIPVCVVLVPVALAGESGLLVIRRAIPPGVGMLALVGGFLEEHETWQTGAAREVFEETGIEIAPAGLSPFYFVSSAPKPDRVLMFSIAQPIDVASLAPFRPDAETSERGIIFGAGGLDEEFAFGLHTEAVRRYFADRGVDRPHRFSPR